MRADKTAPYFDMAGTPLRLWDRHRGQLERQDGVGVVLVEQMPELAFGDPGRRADARHAGRAVQAPPQRLDRRFVAVEGHAVEAPDAFNQEKRVAAERAQRIGELKRLR